MIFYLKLFNIALKSRKKYLYLAFLLVLAYLFLASLFPHNYHVAQEIKAQDKVLLSPGLNPIDMVTVQSILQKSDSFFTDNHVLMDLREHLLTGNAVHRPEWQDWLPSRFAAFIKRAVLQDLEISFAGEDLLVLSYHGTDKELGKALVNFYANRLVWAGQRAHDRTMFRPGLGQEELTLAEVEPGVTLEADLSITTSRTLLTWNRLGNAFWLLLIFVFLALLAIWILQSSSPKLYSERQTARYLNVPVLGCMPSLDRIDRF
jgi:hypothetical protein